MSPSPESPVAAKATPSGALGTCRLPPELLALTLGHLRDQGALGSIAAVQRCSRRSYDIATPVLYGDLHLTSSVNASLLKSFERVSPNELYLLATPQHLDSPEHSIDLPFPCRLRRNLGHVQHMRMCQLDSRKTGNARRILSAVALLSPQPLLPALKTLNSHRPPSWAAESSLGG